jgi:acetolactate synthase-1/2/3 large subunit
VALDKPVILDVLVDQYENCYPMIPAGGANHEMILTDPPELKRKQHAAAGVPGENKDAVLTA